MEKLRSRDLDVMVDPARGADILSIVHSGVDLLYSSPWSDSPALAAPPDPAGDSHARWHQRYRGGWQVLCPNAGDERSAYGAIWGFHGEAALIPWRVRDRGANRISLDTELTSAPLRLRRGITVDEHTVTLVESLTNLGRRELEAHWVHHPAFGYPLIDEDARITTGARRLIADAVAPGGLLEADTAYEWPVEPVAVLPSCDRPRSVFACLTDFDDPAWYEIRNVGLGVGVRVDWPRRIWPHAWLWQEIHGSVEFPWYGRAHACAVEPSTTIPGSATTGEFERGRGIGIPAGATETSTIELTVFHTDKAPE